METFVASPTLLDNVITTHGTILPNEEIELRSETAGQIVTINFRESSRVVKGQLLLQIDDSELVPALNKLKVQLKIARDELERKKQLFDIQGISKDELEEAEMAVNSLESDIHLTEAKIKKTKIIAPFSGIIGLRYVSPGAFVTSGDRIAKLVETDPVKIEFSVPEIYASRIKKGTVIEFALAGSDKKHQAEVYAFEPVIDAVSRNITIRAHADNQQGDLIPGAFVDLTVRLQQIKDALLVPALAVIPDISGQKVFVMKNGKAMVSLVKTGIQKDNLVQITEGIQPGDTVITTSLLSLKEGMAVASKPAMTN
ncbi:MAG TPA: efflux RND transporter periplasmic adaptor subunit [Chitinophagales bacterium]|nr:efflux RND transporter periplasmic adaptor subunit [Chitinophagales bacterium]